MVERRRSGVQGMMWLCIDAEMLARAAAAWKYAEAALAARLASPALLLAFLSTRVIPHQFSRPMKYKLYLELLKRHGFNFHYQMKATNFRKEEGARIRRSRSCRRVVCEGGRPCLVRHLDRARRGERVQQVAPASTPETLSWEGCIRHSGTSPLRAAAGGREQQRQPRHRLRRSPPRSRSRRKGRVALRKPWRRRHRRKAETAPFCPVLPLDFVLFQRFLLHSTRSWVLNCYHEVLYFTQKCDQVHADYDLLTMPGHYLKVGGPNLLTVQILQMRLLCWMNVRANCVRSMTRSLQKVSSIEIIFDGIVSQTVLAIMIITKVHTDSRKKMGMKVSCNSTVKLDKLCEATCYSAGDLSCICNREGSYVAEITIINPGDPDDHQHVRLSSGECPTVSEAEHAVIYRTIWFLYRKEGYKIIDPGYNDFSNLQTDSRYLRSELPTLCEMLVKLKTILHRGFSRVEILGHKYYRELRRQRLLSELRVPISDCISEFAYICNLIDEELGKVETYSASLPIPCSMSGVM